MLYQIVESMMFSTIRTSVELTLIEQLRVLRIAARNQDKIVRGKALEFVCYAHRYDKHPVLVVFEKTTIKDALRRIKQRISELKYEMSKLYIQDKPWNLLTPQQQKLLASTVRPT